MLARRIILFAAALPLLVLPFRAPLDAAAPPPETRLLRTPAVSATKIAFTYAQNIWTVDRAGGIARRLTSLPDGTSNPHFSPDGSMIAFSAAYSGNTDVYVMPAEGGEPKRLTWHPGGDNVQGWTPDGRKVLFTSGRATWGPGSAPRFWTVPVEGGLEEPLPIPRGYQGSISPDGRRIAYRLNTSWDEERRNYRGGQNKAIWIVDLDDYSLEMPPWENRTKEIDPVWLGSSVYWISDRDGVANVWAYDTSTKRTRQMTRFRDFDVKSVDAGAGVVVYEQAGYIHELNPQSGESKRLSISVVGDFPWMMPRWEDVSSRITNMGLSPTGRRAVVEARGEVFTIPVENGDVRNLTRTSGAAEKNPAWSPDGKFVSYFSDASGEYAVMIAPQDGLTPPREIKLPKPTQYYTASWSPDSKKLLYTDTDVKVWVLDVETGQAKIVGQERWMVPARTLNPVWSPDSKWVAYSARLQSLYHAIFAVNIETGQTIQVTDGLADAVFPAWDKSGKYLWFLASTDFGLMSQWLDMTRYPFSQTFGLYFAILKKGEPTPLLPESDEETGVAAGPAPGAPGGGRGGRGGRGGGQAAGEEPPAPPQGPVTVQVDADGLERRIVSVPGVAQQGYSDLQAGVAGTVFYRNGNALMRYRLSDRSAAQFVAGVAGYAMSADGRRLLYRGGGGGGRGARGGGRGGGGAGPALFVVEADRNPPQAGAGRIEATLRMYLEPKEEYKQIFREGWRNQRDYLYVENAHGSDWLKMEEMYGQLLPHVNHRADLNYLLDNMGAELAIGHSYVRGGTMPDGPGGGGQGGLLGADFTIENSRYRIAKIYTSENWNPGLRGPLDEPGVNVNVGDYIIAINNQDLRTPDNIYRLLDGTANRQTKLTVNSTPSADGARDVMVVPVGNEGNLRRQAWVEENRRKVDQLSGGKLAYVHLPNTGQGGYANFNRYYFAQQDKLGAVIDERYNGGGSAADYIIDVLARKFDGYFNNVAGDRTPFTSPSAGIWGPKVMIINEMAGSGGDLMPWMFRHRGIGPLVGTRTWGGLVHTADTPPFIDGGSMIAPRGAFFTLEGEWALENEGMPPDFEVENTPREEIAGHDLQLEKAVEVALDLLAKNPPQRLMKEPAPPNWGRRGGGGR